MSALMSGTLPKVALRHWKRCISAAGHDLFDCRMVCSAAGLQAQEELESLTEHFEEIEELHMCYQDLTDESMAELGPFLTRMPKLRKLSLNGNQITAKGLRILLPFVYEATVRVLELAQNPIGDEGGILLEQLSPYLESLLVNEVEMTSKGILAICQPDSESCYIDAAGNLLTGDHSLAAYRNVDTSYSLEYWCPCEFCMAAERHDEAKLDEDLVES